MFPALIFAGNGGIGLTPLLIYMAALCVIPLAMLWRPILAVYLLVPLMPLQTLRYEVQGFPFGGKFVDALMIAGLIGLFLHKSQEEPVLPKTRLNRYIFIYCLLLYLSLWMGSYILHLPWPIHPSDDRFADWKNLIEMPLLFLLITGTVKTKKQMLTLLALMMLTTLRANIGFYHTVSGRDFSHFSNNLRYAGVLGYAGQNGLAAFMAELLVFLLAIAPAVRSLWYRLLVYGSIAFTGYCVLFCFSRGGYIGVLAGLVILGLLKDRKYLLIVAALLATWQTVVPNAVRERVLMTYDGNQVESSANERLQLWEDAFTIIPEHPIIGTGFVTYRYLGRSEDYLDTHNYYVKVTVETGLVGLGLFAYLLWIIIREGFALFRQSRDPLFQRLGLGLVAMMFCAIAVNCFGDRWMYQQISAYMWTYVALVCRARMIVASEGAAEAVPAAVKTPARGSLSWAPGQAVAE
jgi:putative inorganic carbon (hco3(-)) transporter